MIISGQKVAAAWVTARAAIGGTVAKDAKANYGRYATLAAVMEIVTPALAANKLAIVQEAEMADGEVTVAATVLHESGETIEFAPLTMPMAQRTAQAVGSALTYARRYQLVSIFGLAPDDDDGEAATAPKPTQRPQPARAAQRTAPAQNGSQRPAQPATEPVEHASEDAPPLHQWVYDKLDGKCAKFADWSRTKHANSSGPATPAMYQYLAGVIDGITGNTTHKDVLAVLVGRAVSSDNPPGYDLVSQLLDWLPETVGNYEEKQANPKHEAKYVPCIKAIGDLVLQAQGQTSLFG
jgi:hypothetical protein